MPDRTRNVAAASIALVKSALEAAGAEFVPENGTGLVCAFAIGLGNKRQDQHGSRTWIGLPAVACVAT